MVSKGCLYQNGTLVIPPTLTHSSTMLKFALQMGQLFARSTHGFRHSLCMLCPQGRRCATRSSSSAAGVGAGEASFGALLG